MIGAAVGELVDQRRIAVERKDDGLVLREQRVELPIRDPVRVLPGGLQSEEVHDVDDADFQVRKVTADQ